MLNNLRCPKGEGMIYRKCWCDHSCLVRDDDLEPTWPDPTHAHSAWFMHINAVNNPSTELGSSDIIHGNQCKPRECSAMLKREANGGALFCLPQSPAYPLLGMHLSTLTHPKRTHTWLVVMPFCQKKEKFNFTHFARSSPLLIPPTFLHLIH